MKAVDKLTGADGVKLLAFFLTGTVVVVVEQVPLGDALLLTVASVGAPVGFGALLLSALRLPGPFSIVDRGVVSYLAGWVCLILVAVPGRLVGSAAGGVVIAAVGLAAAAFIAARRRPHPEPWPWRIPPAVYLVAAGYTALSVGLPFAHLGRETIGDAIYGDLVSRFAMSYSVGEGLPPGNPYMAGVPLQYYWFGLLPFGALHELFRIDLFSIWKAGQTWMAFLVLPGIWAVARAIFARQVIAWTVILLGFVFASYEIFASPRFLWSILEPLGNAVVHPGSAGDWLQKAVDAAQARDPDAFLGIMTTYSDQLFMEDFLHIPHNAQGLVVVVAGLFFAVMARRGAASIALGSLAGINSLFLPPAGVAFAALCLATGGVREALVRGTAFLCWTAVSLAACDYVPLAVMFPAALAGAALTAGPLTERLLDPERPRGDSTALLTRVAAAALLLALVVTVLERPLNFLALGANYAPALAIGAPVVLVFMLRPTFVVDRRARLGFLFLIAFVAAHLLASALLYLQFTRRIPAPVDDLPLYVFDFHHKPAKVDRLAWALLAGVAVASLPLGWRALRARPILSAATAVVILLAALTTVVRPFSFTVERPTRERRAGDYLRDRHAGMGTTVLVENTNKSRLPLLVPVGVYYFNPWYYNPALAFIPGNKGLETAVFPFLKQYVAAEDEPAIERRRAIWSRVFKPGPNTPEPSAVLERTGVDYVLSRRRRDFGPGATEVVAQPGGYLYAIRRR